MVGRPLRLLLTAALAMAGGPLPVFAQALPADLRITLERSGCGGDCPVYAVTVDASGTVNYDGRQFVQATGRRSRRVPVARVAALMREAEQIGFFELADDYTFTKLADGTEVLTVDSAVATLTLVHDGRTKRVIDGSYSPLELKRFADHIDAVADTRPWLRLDVTTLQAMVHEHQRLSATELNAFLHTAVEHDDVEVVRALLDLGADPNQPVADGDASPLLLARSATTTQLLLAAGANPLAGNDAGFTPLWRATMGSEAAAQLLLTAGVPVDQPVDETGRTALWHAACYGNRDVVRVLLEAGANAAARFDDRSALECARAAFGRQHTGLDAVPAGGAAVVAFEQDFAETIRLLERALAQQARREPPATADSTTPRGDAATR